MTKLITPCPACGQMPEAIEVSHVMSFSGEYVVKCSNGMCHFIVETCEHQTEEFAIAAWESSFGPKQPEGDVIEVKAAVALDSNGNWIFYGSSRDTLDTSKRWATEDLDPESGKAFGVHVVTASIPIPTVQEIKGGVE